MNESALWSRNIRRPFKLIYTLYLTIPRERGVGCSEDCIQRGLCDKQRPLCNIFTGIQAILCTVRGTVRKGGGFYQSIPFPEIICVGVFVVICIFKITSEDNSFSSHCFSIIAFSPEIFVFT